MGGLGPELRLRSVTASARQSTECGSYALGTHGLTGLISFESALLLPMVILVRRYPVRTWRTPTLAPAAVLATLATLYTIDCIANAMVNPIYFLALGGVTGTLGAMARPRISSRVQPGEADLSELLDHLQDSTSSRTLPGDTGHLAGPDLREEAAIRFGSLGRSLMEHGMAREAEEAWFSARRLWAELAADYPDDLEYRKCWLDGLNDSAWSLIARPGIDDRSLASTIQLAEQTVTLEPESATYWNTLGIAYFRARDWKAAIHALGQSTELGGRRHELRLFLPGNGLVAARRQGTGPSLVSARQRLDGGAQPGSRGAASLPRGGHSTTRFASNPCVRTYRDLPPALGADSASH